MLMPFTFQESNEVISFHVQLKCQMQAQKIKMPLTSSFFQPHRNTWRCSSLLPALDAYIFAGDEAGIPALLSDTRTTPQSTSKITKWVFQPKCLLSFAWTTREASSAWNQMVSIDHVILGISADKLFQYDSEHTAYEITVSLVSTLHILCLKSNRLNLRWKVQTFLSAYIKCPLTKSL